MTCQPKVQRQKINCFSNLFIQILWLAITTWIKLFLWWIDRNILTIKNSRIVNCGEVLREWLRGKLPGKTLFSCSSYTNKQSIPARLANHSGDSTKNKQTLAQINPSIARKELLKSFTDSVCTKNWPWHVFYGIHKEHKLHFFGRVHIVVIKILNKETIRSVSSKNGKSEIV